MSARPIYLLAAALYSEIHDPTSSYVQWTIIGDFKITDSPFVDLGILRSDNPLVKYGDFKIANNPFVNYGISRSDNPFVKYGDFKI